MYIQKPVTLQVFLLYSAPMLIRPMIESDIQRVAEINRAGRIESERGIIMDTDLNRKSVEAFMTDWQEWLIDPEIYIQIAEKDGNICGFVAYGRTKTRPAQDRGVVPKYGAEIYAIYVDPSSWRQGIASALFRTAIDDLISKKHIGLLLWVLKKNKRALAFYETLPGAERIGKQRVDIGEKSWAEETCVAWRDIRKI